MRLDGPLMRKWIEMWSRHLHMEEKGNGWEVGGPELALSVVVIRKNLEGKGK